MRARPSFRASCRSAVGGSGMQCVRSKREPAATSQSIGTGAFAWKSGWSCMDRLPRRGRSSVPPRPLAPWHGQRISGLIAAWARARRSSPVVSSQQSPTCWSKLGDIRPLAKRMEYESIADSNRCLLPADLLTPARCDCVAQFESGVTREISAHGFLPPIHCKSVPGIISSYPCL